MAYPPVFTLSITIIFAIFYLVEVLGYYGEAKIKFKMS